MYTNPEIRSISLFRVVFIIFISVFLVVAIALSVVDTDDGDDPGSVLYLWHSCADLIVSLFVLFPSLKLIKAISYPVIQPEDATCIRWSKVGVWSFCIIYFIRCLYNALHFFEANPIGEWIDVELQKPGKTPSAGVRAYSFMFFIIFDYATALMSIAGVFTLYQHDLKFADDPFYAKIQKINSGPESYEQ
ncbi:hypothetical protein GPJ56_008870 [Histomonas meleagridis]|uniref:uncharacterized protein n=1 Tax=Histomonas meleagridis TaxID=135588 RepID=UPI003559F894|nr:hypothetical protein GPJ56_008870 [Histomonas meleagridis]KAH0797796.1 hypothetical protein GO595_009425 [Histomonas meleagridis]